MDNMDEVSYPVQIEPNKKVMYAYSEWETINQDGDTREKSATPQSFDIMIDNVKVLSNIKSPSGKQTLDFGEFNGKEIPGTGYNITFRFTTHWDRGIYPPCFLYKPKLFSIYITKTVQKA